MTNKQLNQEYKNMIEVAAKMAFITAVRHNGEASLADVAAMAQAEGLGHLTVQEVFFDEIDFGATKGLKALPSAKPAKPTAKATKAADTRTPAARAEYEKRLLESLRSEGSWVSAQELRNKVGGTPLQARKALNRLIEQDLVKFRGKARATQYRRRRKEKKAAAA